MYIANTHGWYNNLQPFGNGAGIISSGATKLNVYYYASTEIASTGGRATAIIIYVPNA